MIIKTFGENLYLLRKENKLTQEEIATSLNVTRQTISNWETDNVKPTIDKVIGLSEIYGVSLDTLIGKEISEARKWVQRFVSWYNNIHLHSGINYLTPYQRHYGLEQMIMEKRNKTYEEAKLKHPERWSKGTRDWSLPEYVSLNPIKENELKEIINK